MGRIRGQDKSTRSTSRAISTIYVMQINRCVIHRMEPFKASRMPMENMLSEACLKAMTVKTTQPSKMCETPESFPSIIVEEPPLDSKSSPTDF